MNGVEYLSEAFGLIKSCFFHGLNPFELLVHSFSSREVPIRSYGELTEPGAPFRNLMFIVRGVVICYDGTVRDFCSNSVVNLSMLGTGEAVINPKSFYPAGEPVGVLIVTTISNPAYKAVLDSYPSSNSSWEMMKRIVWRRFFLVREAFVIGVAKAVHLLHTGLIPSFFDNQLEENIILLDEHQIAKLSECIAHNPRKI